MRVIYLILLGALRVIGGLIAVWQIIGLIPMLTWLKDISSITHDMYFIFQIKVTLLIIGILLYRGLIKPYNKIKNTVVVNHSEENN